MGYIMNNNQKLPRLLPKWFRNFLFYLGWLLLAIPFIFPFWWMANSSFKTYKEIFATRLRCCRIMAF
jgi:ABC-type glycerol-3-phosphate transport system permease component